MDWLDAATAALAIIAVPLALRYPMRGKNDTVSCDCTAANPSPDQSPTIPQEEEPPQERHPTDTR